MRRTISAIAALVFTMASMMAQSATGYQYWFDSDTLSMLAGPVSADKLTLNPDLSDMPHGLHFFNLRLHDADGVWGSLYRKSFVSVDSSSGAVAYQYWFDSDTLSVKTGEMMSEKLTLQPDLSKLPYGIHFFNLRLCDVDSVWGAPYRKSFLTVDSRSGAVAYEYWIDNDFDNKVSEEITTQGAVFNVDMASYPHGLHYFNLRLRTNSNEWGGIYRRAFLATPMIAGAVAYEYWFDEDYENRTEGVIAEGENVYEITLDGLKKGLHRFSYRMKTIDGEWGSVYSQHFYYCSATTFTEYEYWFDNDYTKKVTGRGGAEVTSFNVSLDSLPQNEIHHFNIRVRDDNGEWGSIQRKLLMLYNDSTRVPIRGYSHRINSKDLGYVAVQNNPDGKYTFMVDLPQGEGFRMSEVPVTFDGDVVSVSKNCTFDYKLRINTETGWSPAFAYAFDNEVSYSATAESMNVPSSIKFARPKRTEFKAVKFDTDGRTLYLRTDREATLDIYTAGAKVATIPADSITYTYVLNLAKGTYFGVVYDVAEGDGDVTFHLLDTDNFVPKPDIKFEDGWVEITDRNKDAEIHYTIDDADISIDSPIYKERFEMRRNGVIRAMAVLPGLDLDPSEVALDSISSYVVLPPSVSIGDNGTTITLTANTEGSSLWYAIDDSNTENFREYESPFEMTGNGTIYAQGRKDGWFDSSVVVTTINDKQMPNPHITHDASSNRVSITCAKQPATILYTLDDPDVKGHGIEFKEEFVFDRNGTIRAIAIDPNGNLNDSGIETFAIDWKKVETPVVRFTDSMVVEITSDSHSGVKTYYRLDGQTPTESDTEYNTPFTLRQNANVVARSFKEGYTPSEPGSFNYVHADYITQSPKISIDGLKVTLNRTTDGSTLWYGINESNPDKFELYREPFDIPGNCTLYANARKGGMYDSSVVTLVIDWNKASKPTAKYAAHQLTLTCDDRQAAIYYATDDNAAETEFTRYENPLPLDADCSVRFLARRDHFIDSETGSFEFVLADYKESNATISRDYQNRRVTVNSDDCIVRVTINGKAEEHQAPATIDVTPDMESIIVVALAKNADRYDSDPVEEKLVFHLPPVVNYDGHTISVSIDDNDPESGNDNVRVVAYFKERPFDSSIDVDDFGKVTAYVESDVAFVSDEKPADIDFFNTVKKVGARNGHRLHEAFADWQSETGYPELTVVGEITPDDMRYLAGIYELTTLHLMPDNMEGGSFAGVLSGSRIETVSSDMIPGGLPEGLFADMQRLTTVVWRDAETSMSDRVLGESVNPNLLLWTPDADKVPANVANIVTYSPQEDPSAPLRGHAGRIVLIPGYPYNAHNPIEVDYIEFAKQFSQPTEIDVCRGWETIALPFAPQNISHAEKGAIVPYKEWEKNGYDDLGPKPFWIREATAEGWTDVDSIKAIGAGMPYIISMPNNPAYIESFNLAGEVIFSAENVTLGDNGPDNGVQFPYVSQWKDGMSFHATFMPVEGEHLSLNSGWEEASGDYLPGSVFTADAETLPFEAYVTGTAARFVPLFGGGNGVSLPTLSGISGIRVEVLGQNRLRLTSSRSCRIDINTLTGACVRTVSLTAGESVVVRDLTPGIYLVAGRKVLIR